MGGGEKTLTDSLVRQSVPEPIGFMEARRMHEKAVRGNLRGRSRSRAYPVLALYGLIFLPQIHEQYFISSNMERSKEKGNS